MTRTNEKYRAVYTQYQRTVLEKEFLLNNRFLTKEKKIELSVSLNLTVRQVKIWFQNRRAKERRLLKKQLQETLLNRYNNTNNVYDMFEYNRVLKESKLFEVQQQKIKEEADECEDK